MRPLNHLTEQANWWFFKAREATTLRPVFFEAISRRPRRILTCLLAKLADRDLVWRRPDGVGLEKIAGPMPRTPGAIEVTDFEQGSVRVRTAGHKFGHPLSHRRWVEVLPPSTGGARRS